MATTTRNKAAGKAASKPAPTAVSAKRPATQIAKPAPKRGAKPVRKTPTKVVAEVVPAATVKKGDKGKRPKLVRDSFTIPKPEYQVIDELKERAAKLARPVKKSELIRAGIKALAAMRDGAFLSALCVVPPLKTGRPADRK